MEQFKSYFIPSIKSKYLTYEILSYTFEYLFEVVILLRVLNKQSVMFKERLIDELKTYFK